MNKPSLRSTATAGAFIAAGAIGATALTGFAFAANNGGSGAPAAQPAAGAAATPAPTGAPAPGMDKGMGRRGPGGIGLGGPEGPVLHGDVVVKDKDGVIKTIRVQTGKVTAASSTSITVKSTDDFESAWALTSTTKIRRDMADATADKIAVGDTVMVRGEVAGGNATAKVVRAFTADGLAKAKAMRESMKQNRQDMRQGMRKGMMQNGQGGTSDPAEDASLAGLGL